MKRTLLLILLIIFIFYFWDNIVLYPLKLLVVFFHESSHAIMTLLTGGKVVEMALGKSQGGHCISAGGHRFLILSAGYLGSLLWGGLIYTSAVKTKNDRKITLIVSIIILILTLLYIRNVFGLIFCFSTAVILYFISKKATNSINDFVLRLIGLTSMIYVPIDIYSDTIARSHLRSDARMLAEEFGGTTILWGGFWMIISIILLGYFIIWGIKHQKGFQ